MRKTLLMLSLLAPLSFAQAETLALPDEPSAAAIATPGKGMSMASVKKQFGQPVKTYKAVGGASKRQPPITRWDYSNFYVFFEHGHVVDAVVPDAPPELKNTEQLQSN